MEVTAKAILLFILQKNSFEFDTKDINVEQAYCLALNIYHEARGEPIAGQVAVGNVVLNRIKDPRYPSTPCAVITQGVYEDSKPVVNMCQFSWYCDGRPDNVRFIRVRLTEEKEEIIDTEAEALAFIVATEIALKLLKGRISDNTGGATHYYNSRLASPSWAALYQNTAKYGEHDFLLRESGSIY